MGWGLLYSLSIVMLPFELISSMRQVPPPIVPTSDSSDDDVIVIGSALLILPNDVLALIE